MQNLQTFHAGFDIQNFPVERNYRAIFLFAIGRLPTYPMNHSELQTTWVVQEDVCIEWFRQNSFTKTGHSFHALMCC